MASTMGTMYKLNFVRIKNNLCKFNANCRYSFQILQIIFFAPALCYLCGLNV